MSRMRVLVKLAPSMAAFVLVAACSPAPMQVSQSRHDPSSPNAPEGASPVMVAAAIPAPPSSEPAAKSGGHDHHGHAHAHDEANEVPASSDGGTEGVVYVCPMHPEVTSNAPGALCPKCNMKLVPKK